MEIYGTDDYSREMEERKMITGNKLERYLERCEGERKPITAEVFLSDCCNLSCNYCRYGHESGKTMDYRDFVVYAKRLVEMGVRGIILPGGGRTDNEPSFWTYMPVAGEKRDTIRSEHERSYASDVRRKVR